jgi:hypothetical protein
MLPFRPGDIQGVHLRLLVAGLAAENLVVDAQPHRIVAVQTDLAGQSDHAGDLVGIAVNFDHDRHHIANPAPGVAVPLAILTSAVLLAVYLIKGGTCCFHGRDLQRRGRPGKQGQASRVHTATALRLSNSGYLVGPCLPGHIR